MGTNAQTTTTTGASSATSASSAPSSTSSGTIIDISVGAVSLVHRVPLADGTHSHKSRNSTSSFPIKSKPMLATSSVCGPPTLALFYDETNIAKASVSTQVVTGLLVPSINSHVSLTNIQGPTSAASGAAFSRRRLSLSRPPIMRLGSTTRIPSSSTAARRGHAFSMAW